MTSPTSNPEQQNHAAIHPKRRFPSRSDRLVNIAIVEDDPIWLSLMTDFLNQEEDFQVVATAVTKEEAIGLTRLNLNIHVMLMDINLTGNYCDGINASLHIRETTDTKVVMLT